MSYKVSHRVLKLAHHSEKVSLSTKHFLMDVLILLNTPFKLS